MVPTNSKERLRSCCTAGATSTVGGGSGGGGFLHPTATSAPSAPATTAEPTPARVICFLPGWYRRDVELLTSRTRVEYDLGDTTPGVSAGWSGRRRVHHRGGVVGGRQRNLDPPVL